MWRFKLVGVILGGILAFWGFNENKLNQNMTSEPEEVTMATLEKGDYEGSNHVKITNFAYLYYQLIYEAKVGKYDNDVKEDSKVNFAYVPIVSNEHKFMGDLTEFIKQLEQGDESAAEPVLSDYTVLIKTKKYTAVNQLPTDFEIAKEPVQGIFINKISSLGQKEKDLLLQGCPGIDLDKVLILEEGRTPSSAAAAYGAMIGGALISLLSILWFFKKKA